MRFKKFLVQNIIMKICMKKVVCPCESDREMDNNKLRNRLGNFDIYIRL